MVCYASIGSIHLTSDHLLKDEVDRLLGRQAKQALSCVSLVVVREGEEAEHGECTVCLDAIKVRADIEVFVCEK